MKMRDIIDIVESLDKFSIMTKKEFLGEPKITSNKNADRLRPRVLTTLQNAPRQKFLDDYEASYNEDGAVVYNGSVPIASYNFGNTLVVDSKYRGRGIGKELVYQYRIRFPDIAKASHRTKTAHKIQQEVWDRIQSELSAKNS